MNTWLLAKDLKTMASASDDQDFQELCGLIEENYGYPVDSVVISPDLEVLGHLNVNDAFGLGPRGYLAFLDGEELPTRSKVDFQPESHSAGDQTHGHGHDHESDGVSPSSEVVLTLDQPTGSILDLIRSPLEGQLPFTLFPIDVLMFREGGVIEVEVEVGTGETTGSFELLRTDPDHIPPAMFPVASLSRVPPGHAHTMKHTFEEGEVFHLLVRVAPGSPDGSVNAFRAVFRVKEGGEE